MSNWERWLLAGEVCFRKLRLELVAGLKIPRGFRVQFRCVRTAFLGIMPMTEVSTGRDAALRRPRPERSGGRNER